MARATKKEATTTNLEIEVADAVPETAPITGVQALQDYLKANAIESVDQNGNLRFSMDLAFCRLAITVKRTPTGERYLNTCAFKGTSPLTASHGFRATTEDEADATLAKLQSLELALGSDAFAQAWRNATKRTASNTSQEVSAEF